MAGIKFGLLSVLGLCTIVTCCSSKANDPNESGLVEVQLVSTDPSCASQRALVPSSGVVNRSVVPASSDVQRISMNEYVAYQVVSGDTTLYLSFAPSLPVSFSTELARAAFQYAYVSYDLKQPADIGGSLSLLDSGSLLALGDFERFEVVAGALSWRLVRSSKTDYVKKLSIYDADPSNDPANPASCTGGGDIQGLCTCEFNGPRIQVTLDGTVPE